MATVNPNGHIARPYCTAGSVAAKSVRITGDDNGKTFDVKAGQDIVVTLSENATSGFQWVVTGTDRTFGYPAKNDYVRSAPGNVGSGGVRTMVWKTTGPLSMVGSHSVEIAYVRPGNKTEREGTFKFTVNIK
jgi:predicted secreted protein